MGGIVWKAVAQGGIVRGNCPGRYQFGVNCPRRNCPRAVCHVDDYHTRNGIAHLNVLCCRRTKSDISRIWSTYKAVIILFYTQILVHPDWDSNCHINRTLGIIHIYVRKTFRKTNISEKLVHVPNKWAPPLPPSDLLLTSNIVLCNIPAPFPCLFLCAKRIIINFHFTQHQFCFLSHHYLYFPRHEQY